MDFGETFPIKNSSFKEFTLCLVTNPSFMKAIGPYIYKNTIPIMSKHNILILLFFNMRHLLKQSIFLNIAPVFRLE